jgi:H+/gluconate symporter-like permease
MTRRRVSRVERAAAGSSCGHHGGGLRGRTGAGALDPDLHGQRRPVRHAVLPHFLLGALFAKLMDDSGWVSAVSRFVSERMGTQRTMLVVVLAGALVTYGGVSLFVTAFVLAPLAKVLFQTAGIPHHLMAATVALGTRSFTTTALPGTPAAQNAIPMPFFDTTLFAAPGLGIIASLVMLGFGMWWLQRVEAAARRAGDGYGGEASITREAEIGGLVVPRVCHHGARVRPGGD